MLNTPNPVPQVIYEADPVHVDTVINLKKQLHGVCKKQLMNKHVLVRTIDGQEYEGVIVYLDDGHLYMALAEDGTDSRFFPFGGPGYPGLNPAGGAILPLVLYNLLAITLLTT